MDINDYLSYPTIRTIKSGFKTYLLSHAFSQYKISYAKVSNCIHPTVFTNDKGDALKSIASANLGRMHDEQSQVANQYLFDEVFYDSPLEKDNIISFIKEVTVFTKIPKNSIAIPVAGGGTYSPDFAYVVRYGNGQQTLNLVVETKDTEATSLRDEEQQKIKHAEALFNQMQGDFKVSFQSQFKADVIKDVIQRVLSKVGAD